MKTLLLAVEVPEGAKNFVLRYQDPDVPDKVYTFETDIKQIMLPSEKDVFVTTFIHKITPYREHYNIGVKDGANFVINHIKNQMKP